MKKFILKGIEKHHEPYVEGSLNTTAFCDAIRNRAYQLSNFGGMKVEHTAIFEYERNDNIKTRLSSYTTGGLKYNVSFHGVIYKLEYSLEEYASLDEAIVGAIAVIYINGATTIPCACDLYAFTNCNDEIELIYSVDHLKYKKLFKTIKAIAKESPIMINGCRFVPFNYEDYHHRHFYIPSKDYQIIDNATIVENILI